MDAGPRPAGRGPAARRVEWSGSGRRGILAKTNPRRPGPSRLAAADRTPNPVAARADLARRMPAGYGAFHLLTRPTARHPTECYVLAGALKLGPVDPAVALRFAGWFFDVDDRLADRPRIERLLGVHRPDALRQWPMFLKWLAYVGGRAAYQAARFGFPFAGPGAANRGAGPTVRTSRATPVPRRAGRPPVEGAPALAGGVRRTPVRQRPTVPGPLRVAPAGDGRGGRDAGRGSR